LLYKERTGNPNATTIYKTHEGYRLGTWQRSQRQIYSKGKLSTIRIKRLEEIGFTWELLEEQFERGFQETLIYKKSTGTPNVTCDYKTPEGYLLGKWQSHQRGNYKKRKISPDRIKRLEEIGFTWEPFEEKFEKGYQETLKFKAKTGNSNAHGDYNTSEGYRLGNWQSDQRKYYKKGKLSSDRIERLEKIGFIWDILEEWFEKGFQETLLYKKSTANPNAPATYKTAESFLLGSWQSNQRKYYKEKKLSSERIERLEKIGFIWKILEEQFEKGFQETLLYKERTGNSNAPQNYKTAAGFRLGIWQSGLRSRSKKNKLSSDQIERLENIGFIWDRFEEQFEKGFEETLLYKERTGNPNAPVSYNTADGFLLGHWQSNQKTNYKKGNLSPDRIKRLEDIGFKWGRQRS
jgi:uncharacterized protein (DUF2384 family)